MPKELDPFDEDPEEEKDGFGVYEGEPYNEGIFYLAISCRNERKCRVAAFVSSYPAVTYSRS